jgi:hypothetical protein
MEYLKYLTTEEYIYLLQGKEIPQGDRSSSHLLSQQATRHFLKEFLCSRIRYLSSKLCNVSPRGFMVPIYVGRVFRIFYVSRLCNTFCTINSNSTGQGSENLLKYRIKNKRWKENSKQTPPAESRVKRRETAPRKLSSVH